MLAGYNARKAAHVAAFFALKAGGKINVLKIAKLLYLAERESMQLYDEPMFYDRYFSMDHGPVTSITLNLINGDTVHPDWKKFISNRKGYDIAISDNKLDLNQLDELSRADRRILDSLWEKFGHMDRYELREYTHKQCPEWEHPDGTSTIIENVNIFKALMKDNPEELSEDIKTYRKLATAIS